MELHDLHRQQIARYTSWFAGRRSKASGLRDAELEDFCSDRLSDEAAIFNNEDVLSLLNDYHAQVMGRFREDMDKTVNLSAAYAIQLLQQAEAHNVILQVEDVSTIEDQNKLDQVSCLSAMGAPSLVGRRSTLQSMEPSTNMHSQADTVALMQQIQELSAQCQELGAEKQRMVDRNTRVEMELTNMSRENSQMSADLRNLRDEQSLGAYTANANLDQYALQLQELRREFDSKNHENEALRSEMGQRLAESAQFKQLKSIVKQKSEEVKDLKHRLMAAGLMLPEADPGQHFELTADSD